MPFINWGHESPEQKEIRRRMEERMLFEQMAYNAGMAAAAAAGVGSGGLLSGSFQCVIDTTNDLEFRLAFVSTNEPIKFTIDWGDGNTYNGSGYGGFYEEFHMYEDAGEYTVNVTFNKPQNVLQLDFAGPDDGYSTLIAITGLQSLKNLEEFRADYNSLESVDLSGLTSLNYVDISDCDEVNSISASLKNVILTGCTSLTELRLDDSDFSDGIPNLDGLPLLEWIDFDQCGITGSIDLSSISSLRGFDLSGNSNLTSVIIPNNQQLGIDWSVNLSGCALTQQSVDNILIALSTNGGSNGYVNLESGTNSIPSAAGLEAKAVLEGNGWGVQVNLPPPGSVSIPASTDFDIVGDFTIEMFVKFSNLSGNIRPYSFGAYPIAANAVSFESGTMYFWANSGSRSFGSFTPNIGQWYHVCIMRFSGDIYLFIDGARIAVYLYPDPIPSQGLPLTIGNGNEANSSLNGLISNFRWTSSALYDTVSFTPPSSPLTDLSDTKLLIFQGTDLSSMLTDNSGNGHNATGTGTFAYSSEDPFSSAQGSLQVGTV